MNFLTAINKHLRLLVVLGAALAFTITGASNTSAATVGIDNFNDAQEVCDPIADCGPAATQSSVATANAIGGQRDISVARLSGSNGVSARSADTADYFSYSADNFTQGTFELVYDGDSDPSSLSPTGLGGVDLTDGGTNTGIYFREVYNDIAFTLQIEIYTDAINYSIGTISVPAGQSGSNLNVAFASFSIGGGTGADFSNVGAIRITDQTAVTALDFSVDYIAADSSDPTAVALSTLDSNINTNNQIFVVMVIVLMVATSTAISSRRNAYNNI